MPVIAYGHHYGGHSLIDSFMRGAAWSAARRFIYSLPMPVILIIAAVCIFGFILSKAAPRRSRR